MVSPGGKIEPGTTGGERLGDTRMEVRVPVGALKRLTPVEQRGTGRLIEKGQIFGKQTRLNSAAKQSGVA